MATLPADLQGLQEEIEAHARSYGLDFFPVIFEMLDYRSLNQVASYGGFPTRYPHWRFGMEYEYLTKSYSYGLSKIYEMVINNDPCYAYLLECNSRVDQKLVMAHVYAHCDFFKNNFSFTKTNRKMMDEMANHATRIRRYMDKHGVEEVETFVDTCLSLENLIDAHAPFIVRDRPQPREEEPRPVVKRLKSKSYMNDFINPPQHMETQQKKLDEEARRKKRFPESPAKDVLRFLIDSSPLENWQRDILAMIREEAYYFAPQAQTKIMNEGWATYWHSKLMTEKVLTDAEVIDYADHHSGTLGGRTGRLNPYKLGVELYRNIEERWNKGRFGKEYDDCEDLVARARWDRKLGLGRDKIFEVRRLCNDVTFIDNYRTEDFCREHKMFIYDFNPKTGAYQISDRDFKKVKQRLLFQLTNFGQPFIFAADGNFRNKGELLLQHKFEGVELKHDYARETLKGIQSIWGRPVSLETVVDQKARLISFNGEEFEEKDVSDKVA
ncbi:MAG TPA: SpoVR family protein [Candidatus Polarisedimenticolia bacterium]|nr:SpoVR family protein [Candidatus Polarisedimenticolia bacterium]